MHCYVIKVILMSFSYLHAAGSNKYESIMRLWKSRVCIRYESGIIGHVTDCQSLFEYYNRHGCIDLTISKIALNVNIFT